MDAMNDSQLFLYELNAIIEDRKKATESFYDDELTFCAKEYFDTVHIEMRKIAYSIFSDQRFFEEQFNHYSNFADYINDIVNDMIREDFGSVFQ